MLGPSRQVPWWGLLLVTLAFGISYSQYPLFYHTQNQYFFHGVARTGFGQLMSDWFAKTPDPWPVFTAMVELTYRYLDPRMFYVYFVALLGVYVISLLGILSVPLRIGSSKARLLVFLAVITALHSPLFGYVSRLLFGLPIAESSPHHFNIGRILLLEGVGEKRILGDMLNPGTFGVLLLLSVYLFLRGRPFLAATAAVVAAMFQPSYVLHGGVLIATYMFIMAKRREGLGRSLGLGLYAFALILPLLVFVGVVFRQTDPAIWKQTQEILVRIAYYPPSVPGLWLGGTAYIKMALVLVALSLIWRSDLFWILLTSFAAATGLTAVQMLTGSTTLAVLLPWRISAFLVPLSTLIIVGAILSRLLDRYERRIPGGPNAWVAIGVASLVVLVAAGVAETKVRFDAVDRANRRGVIRFVQTTSGPGQVYLIPPNWRDFRLVTGAPAFAERSVIPYNDVGIMGWYQRVRLADAFYGTAVDDTEYRSQRQRRRAAGSSAVPRPSARTVPPKAERCRRLGALSAEYDVTHVVLEGEDLEGCDGWKLAFRDETHRVYVAVP